MNFILRKTLLQLSTSINMLEVHQVCAWIGTDARIALNFDLLSILFHIYQLSNPYKIPLEVKVMVERETDIHCLS